MDCETARLLLPYLNPRAEQLPAELAQALEAHVGECALCTATLQNTGREDRIIAVAMKSVEIPEGLRERLVSRLRPERLRWRSWPVRHPRWSAAAAVLLLCMGTAFGYWLQKPLPVDMVALTDWSDQAGTIEQADNLLAVRHLSRPGDLRYGFLVSSSMVRFQGKLVPCLLFEGNAGQIAEVYVLTNRDFDLEASSTSPAGSGNFTIALLHELNSKVAYLVRYSGDSLEWLRQPDKKDA